MKKRLALLALVALLGALAAVPAMAKQRTTYALAGEARALEVAILNEGVTLGLALTEADSTPQILGIGAGQCTLLGDTVDPSSLPCTSETTQKSAYPGEGGDGAEKCAGALPAPLDTVLTLKVACGSSLSKLVSGLPMSKNTGKVLELAAKAPLDLQLLQSLLPGGVGDDEAINDLVGDLTGTLAPILDQAPDEVEGALQNILQIVESATDTEAIRVELGPSVSNITPKGQTVTVDSTAAGARIGVLGLPTVDAQGLQVEAANPLENGLVIVEVGQSQASATLDHATATARSAASAALVTVKVRDVTSPTPKYVEVAVAPGQTITLLEGTPAESTITAADSTVEERDGSASAAADAVSVHLLKGVNGGVRMAFGRSVAAITADQVQENPPTQKKPPTSLPVTGGMLPYGGIALVLLLSAAGALVARRRFGVR